MRDFNRTGQAKDMNISQGSVWSATTERNSRPAFAGDTKTDVLVIGGGMCGVLVAHELKQAGLRCVVVESKQIGGGVTRNTTAKITAQHGLIYADLLERIGHEKAWQYYQANTQAIKKYQALAAQFPCDFEHRTAYVYSTDDSAALEREARAYHQLGLAAHVQEDLPLPVNTCGALAMENQAQFHPLKLLFALAENLELYENTFVNKLVGKTAHTPVGTITAEHVVLATHYPLVNILGLYALKLYQHRSYVIALENAQTLDGMYVDARENGHSFRTYGDLLFVGGGDHRTGEPGGGFHELHALAGRAYPQATEQFHWATQDCMSLDRVPYIGKHRAGANHLYVATGFNKWGMTGSMVAAQVLCELITQGKSDLSELYSPQRSMLSRQLATNMGKATKNLLSFGTPRCMHMGCKLRWNSAEHSWDCACHGSRFDACGHVMDGPAKRGIKPS
ncbi:MAG: FAD-dependent oxidoreductase [Oscillospiraceae bacterium]|nr:FAD-dependent oxidoreductase [Oscillospiraceae bacterium]